MKPLKSLKHLTSHTKTSHTKTTNKAVLCCVCVEVWAGGADKNKECVERC